MKLVDIGANLTHNSFEQDFEKVITEASEAGLAHIIVTGTDLETSKASQIMCTKHPKFLSSTVGFHPHISQTITDSDIEAAAELSCLPHVVAIGEIGLDFNRNFSPAEYQLRVFEQLLELAADLHKPVFLHQRDAHDAFYELIKNYRSKLVGGVVHCFTDSEKALADYLELDMHIGITGWICDERRGGLLQSLVAKIPDNRLLIETDAPYLFPRTLLQKQGRHRNEPKYLTEIVNVISHFRGQDPNTVAQNTTRNAIRLFGLNNDLAEN